MTEDNQHSKSETKIEADKVQTVCSCGWMTPKVDSETEANQLLEVHQQEALNGSP